MKKNITKAENKLTLSVNKELVEKAKIYTTEANDSISNLVTDFLETYIAMKTNHKNTNHHFSSHASKFAGIVSLKNSSSNKSSIADTIIAKHTKRFK